jgi:peptide/nickel transport system substrate-binding protein
MEGWLILKLNTKNKGGRAMQKLRGKERQARIFKKSFLSENKGILRIAKCIFLLLLLVAVGVLLGHANALSAETKTLRTVVYEDPQSLDPAHIFDPTTRFIAQQVFQGLLEFDLNAEPPYPMIPSLAKSYEVSEDARMVTFKLQEGVRFHGGYGEFTSGDVVFTLQRYKDPKVAAKIRRHLADVERIEAPDKYTVKLYLKEPTAFTLLGNLAWGIYISSKRAVEELGDKIEKKPIGTGPFYYAEWIPGEKVVLKKFEDYWRSPAKIDNIEIEIVPEEGVALGALGKGRLDLVVITQPASVIMAETMKDVYIAEAKGPAWQNNALLNHKAKPLGDLRVRKALCYALDVEGMVKRVGKLAVPWPGMLPPGVFSATDEFWTYTYDIGKAKQLLAEAGYPNGFELVIIYHKDMLYENVAIELQRSWGNIVDVKLKKIEHAVYYKTIHEHNYHVAIWALTRLVPYLIAERTMTGAPENRTQYSNPELDEVIKKAYHAKTEGEAKKYWRKWQQIAHEDVIQINPFLMNHLAAVNNKLKGLALHPYVRIVDLERAYFVD